MTPNGLFTKLDAQSYRIERPKPLVRFFEKGRTRVSNQTFPNKSAIVSKDLRFDWYYSRMSDDSLRMNLKENFFKYPSSASSNYLAGLAQLRKQMVRNSDYPGPNNVTSTP